MSARTMDEVARAPGPVEPGDAAAGWPFVGGSEMAERMRAYDWARSPLGPVQHWPPALKVAVATLLECRLPMFVAWGERYVQFYNDAYRPILGNKHPAALGQSTPECWSEIWPRIGPMWEQVRAGQPIGFEDFQLTIDRYGYPEDCWFNFSYSPLRDDRGRTAGVLVTFAETTRRVRSEARLRFLDELAQATRALENPEQVMQTAAELLGRHLRVNRCAYANVLEDQDTFDLIGDFNDGVPSIVGRYRFTDFGTAVHRLMVSDQAYVNHDVDADPRTAGSDLSAYRATRIQSVICVPLHKQGRFVAGMAVHQAQPRHWSEDEVDLVRTVVDRCWETLERIRSDAALRAQQERAATEARLLELLNRTGAALSAELDLQALLQRVTDAATELTGAAFGAFFYNGVDEQGDAYLLYTLAGAPREAFEKLGHPRPTALFGPTFRGEPPVRIDDVLQDPRYGQWGPHHGMPQGHLPVRSYLAVPVLSRSGQAVGGLFFGHPEPGVFTERSERLAGGIAGQAAIAIDNARLYAQSRQLAEERRALLDSERAARSEAERASSLKDEFLATLSHELRTPLSAILGWVHILRRKAQAGPPELLKGVDVIERSTRIQVQLIDDLLDMSRIMSGKLRLEPQPIAPVAVVQAALDVIAPAAEAAGVHLSFAADPVDSVHGDAGRLQQVVWNLLANAVKFTPRGGDVRVTLRPLPAQVEIAVQDTGVGIRPEFLPHLFERFRQADGSITRRFGGLGLGLSIVRHLVELHGGAVRAESEGENRGARFVITLPALGSAVALRTPAPEAAPESLAGVHVLVVDDEPDARDLLQRLLEESGAEVTTAGSAEEALGLLASRRPAVLVSDIGMPGMDGYELIRRIRRLPDPRACSLPAIALTAFARAEDRERAQQAGFDAHVAKPMEPPQVLAAVGRLARRR